MFYKIVLLLVLTVLINFNACLHGFYYTWILLIASSRNFNHLLLVFFILHYFQYKFENPRSCNNLRHVFKSISMFSVLNISSNICIYICFTNYNITQSYFHCFSAKKSPLLSVAANPNKSDIPSSQRSPLVSYLSYWLILINTLHCYEITRLGFIKVRKGISYSL